MLPSNLAGRNRGRAVALLALALVPGALGAAGGSEPGKLRGRDTPYNPGGAGGNSSPADSGAGGDALGNEAGATRGGGGGTGGASDPSLGGGGGATVDEPVPGSVAALLGYAPSNVPGSLAAPEDLTDWSYDSKAALNTDTLTWSSGTQPEPVAMELSDGSEAALIVVQSLTTSATSRLSILGHRPLIIVAVGDVRLNGLIDAYEDPAATQGYIAGGAPGPVGPERNGLGPGGGKAGLAKKSDGKGGGGGAYCGRGGDGSNGIPGGEPYGTEELVPLLGGSSGGTATDERISQPGASLVRGVAGGAVQISAGGKLLVDPNGVIAMVGHSGWNGTGGSSGGAILLEASMLTVAGVLSANGAPGSGAELSGHGTLTLTPGEPNEYYRSAPGAGSAGETLDGAAGTTPPLLPNRFDDPYPAGGGGGVGRIRLNAGSGTPTIQASALVSPAVGTACTTFGSL